MGTDPPSPPPLLPPPPLTPPLTLPPAPPPTPPHVIYPLQISCLVYFSDFVSIFSKSYYF